MKQFNHVMLITFLALSTLIAAPELQARTVHKFPPIDKNSAEYRAALAYEKQIQQNHQVTAILGDSRTIEVTRTTFPNFLVSTTGSTDTTEFTFGADDGLRDSHFSDAYNGVIAFSWTDNSTVSDTANNTLNTMVAIGTANANGTYTIGSPINLTGFTTQSNMLAWDTAVAINRTNSQNIVVSWLLINDNTGTALPYRAYTTNGGANWTVGLMTQQPASQQVGDNRGVVADKYGNIWYLATNLTMPAEQCAPNQCIVNQPYFSVSSDGGNTFQLAYTLPFLPDFEIGTSLYDYPQFCPGGLGDGSGTYGLWFDTDYFQNGEDITPLYGFIPITGLGLYGSGTYADLSSLGVNEVIVPTITASQNGRVWLEGMAGSAVPNSVSVAMRYKTPGALNTNYWGPYLVATVGNQWLDGNAGEISQPSRGYFNVTVQGNMYDEARQALYALVTNQVPDEANEQNMQILFYISRNNGQTWGATPINIATTTFANRGFPSMALDTVTGDLLFGWYDGRNDDTYKSVEYYAAIVSAATLTTLTNSVPGTLPSYPIYPIPF